MRILNKKHHLSIFDFDDTLVFSDNHYVKIQNPITKEIKQLTSNEWKHYIPKINEEIYDFSDFEKLNNPRKNPKLWNIFKARLANKDTSVVVLSARTSLEPLFSFFLEEKLIIPHVVCLAIAPGENNGIHKARWIQEEINEQKPKFVEFYDDRDDNVTEVHRLKKENPSITFKIGKVIGEEIHLL